jgi:cell division protein FtsZ
MIKVMVAGVGGAGGNALSYMANEIREDIRMIAINTDAQALEKLKIKRTLVIGESGLGAGSKPEVAEDAMRASLPFVRKELEGIDILFITAGMGGGTGTGAAQILAKEAKNMDIMVVSVVSMPFSFERRDRNANAGLEKLSAFSDAIVVISNDRIAQIYNGEFREVFAKANAILSQAIVSLVDLVEKPGLINIDFEDVKTILGYHGKSVFGTGKGKGENRWMEAIEGALLHPLMSDVNLKDAKGVLINVVSKQISMSEYSQIGDMIVEYLSDDMHTIMGACFDDTMADDELIISVIVTGIEETLTTESVVERVRVGSGGNMPFLANMSHSKVNPAMTSVPLMPSV